MSIIVTISIVCHNQVEITKECVAYLQKNTPREGIEYIFSDNASTDGTYEFLSVCDLPNKYVVLYAENLGFQLPHNEALIRARGEYFIVLNNDIFLKSDDWLQKVLQPLIEEENVALVGLEGNPSALRSDGNGVFSDRVEYIEGSCIVARTHELRKYGLFSPALRKFYYDDSDLSLRFRQMGREIRVVPVSFKHIRGVTSNAIDNKIIQDARKHNKRIWFSRWENYMRNRQLTNKVLIKIRSAGIGDVLAVTPVLEALRRDHPTAEFTIDTNQPDVFDFNPNANHVIDGRLTQPKTFDRVLDLMPPPGASHRLNFASYKPFCKNAEHLACTRLMSPFPKLYLSRYELDYGSRLVREAKENSDGSKPLVALSPFTSRTSWEGKSWWIEEAKRLVAMLNAEGYPTLEIGKDVPKIDGVSMSLVNNTTLREFFSIIANLQDDVFITIDSLGLWVAQAFGVPTLVLMGATEPISRVLDFSKVSVVRNEGLSCLGCYQKKGDPGYNQCAINLQACMTQISAELVMAYITGDIDGVVSNILYLQSFAEGRLK